jgi:acetyl esterase/lipase
VSPSRAGCTSAGATRRAASLAALALALALTACGGGGGDAAPPDDGPRRTVVGEGRTSATVFLPRGGSRGRVGVLFLHGWGATEPRTYGPWIRHLVGRGHVVIYPRYQDSVADPPPEALPSAVIGVRSALTRAPGLRELVVVGHSAGGALGPDLAALAPDVGLPRPRAVLSLYAGRSLRGTPGARIPEGPLERIPASTRVEVLAGDDDRVVGTRFARRIARRTGGRFTLITGEAVDDHLAPQRADAASRRTFWTRLDRLIAAR